jgi:hypothetical protein
MDAIMLFFITFAFRMVVTYSTSIRKLFRRANWQMDVKSKEMGCHTRTILCGHFIILFLLLSVKKELIRKELAVN